MAKRVQGLTKATLRRAAADERRAQKARGTQDSFTNWSINIGMGTNNALSAGTYGFNPITRIRTLVEWMYRGNWLARVMVDQIAKDMTRGGVDLHTDADPEDLERVEHSMARLKVWAAICDVVKWAKLYGGAVGYIMIDGADPETPLRPEAVGKGTFRGIMVLDRWMLEPLLNRLVMDGPDVGLPEFYRVTTDAPGLKGKVFHHSRGIRLLGVKLPYWQSIMENYWGLSVFEPIYDRMVAFDSATMGAAQLAYKCHLRTMKIKNYRQIMAAGGQLAVGLARQMDLVRQYASIEGLTVVDAEDTVETQSASFAGLSEVMLQIGQQISGGIQVPLTKLFGQSPAGLNATGEADIRGYYDGIAQEQADQLGDPIHKLYRVAAMSEGVDLGEQFKVTFRPLWQLSDSERAEIEEKSTRSVLAVDESGLVSPQTALKELKARGHDTNTWQTITEEDIAAADDEVPPAPEPGEVVGPGGEVTPGAVPAGGALKKELGGRDRVRDHLSRVTEGHWVDAPTSFQGLPIVVECPKGGQRWAGAPVLPAHYGYIAGVGSAEGDTEWMDCFVGDAADAPYAYVLDQYDGDRFDEHKVMLGFPDLTSAQRAYTQAYSGMSVRASAASQMTMAQLRDWMSRGKNQVRPAMIGDGIHRTNLRRVK